jgi:hypothetical protein
MRQTIISTAIALAFGLGVAFTAYAQEGRVETGAKLSPDKVTGEVTKIDGDTYFVKDKTGKEVKFTVEKDRLATLERPLKVGDQIEAQLTPEGFAKSIRMAGAGSGAAGAEKGKDQPGGAEKGKEQSGGKDIGTIQAPGSIEGGKSSEPARK